MMRATAFIDGQNLFHFCRTVFGCGYPDFDPQRLAAEICHQQNWQLTQVRFYTGVHEVKRDYKWHHFWMNKLAAMRAAGVHVYSRPLAYSPGPSPQNTRPIAREKGIDLRLALDAIDLYHQGSMDVALIFSQDQDLTEAVNDLKMLRSRCGRSSLIANAYPQEPPLRSAPGIRGAEAYVTFNHALYRKCVDPAHYFP